MEGDPRGGVHQNLPRPLWHREQSGGGEADPEDSAPRRVMRYGFEIFVALLHINLTFCDKQRMKQHELWHEGIRLHACPICKVAYMRKGNMRDHVKRVHKKTLADVLGEIEK